MRSHVADNPDAQWQHHLADYLVQKDIKGCYWSINPESADTGLFDDLLACG